MLFVALTLLPHFDIFSTVSLSAKYTAGPSIYLYKPTTMEIIMKLSIIKQLAILAVSGAIAATNAYAHEAYSEAGNEHWLGHLSEAGTGRKVSAPYGYAMGTSPDREVNLAGNSKYLNVARLETVRINFAGKSVIWKFDTANLTPFNLSKIIPGADSVTVYLSESPTYQGGN